jgi:hypothetical protein
MSLFLKFDPKAYMAAIPAIPTSQTKAWLNHARQESNTFLGAQ